MLRGGPFKGIPAWSNLKAIYERMHIGSSPAALARLREKTHLLNEIHGDAKDLKRNLGTEDKATLDEYLQAISELETKIENDRLWAEKGAAGAPLRSTWTSSLPMWSATSAACTTSCTWPSSPT
ncbi:MAG: hypothetical protein ACI8W8_002969 [Rhodothermales bacterium]